MSTEGVDYAWDRPTPAELVAAGKHFACRYHSWDPSKNLTRAEANRLAAAGIWCVSNWEATANGALEYQKARAVAIAAADQADDCGQPADRPIYFSVDFDASPAQLAGPVASYFRIIADEIGHHRVGAYGGYRTIKYLFDNDLISWGWQTYAWSGEQWDDRAHIRQYHNGVNIGGNDVDLDRAMVADYGQWKPGELPMAETLRGDRDGAALIHRVSNGVIKLQDPIAIGVPYLDGPNKGKEILEPNPLAQQLDRIETLAGKPAAIITAEVLREALLDPVVLQHLGRAVAGEIAALRFESVQDQP